MKQRYVGIGGYVPTWHPALTAAERNAVVRRAHSRLLRREQDWIEALSADLKEEGVELGQMGLLELLHNLGQFIVLAEAGGDRLSIEALFPNYDATRGETEP